MQAMPLEEVLQMYNSFKMNIKDIIKYKHKNCISKITCSNK
jgi:hypothetical protein